MTSALVCPVCIDRPELRRLDPHLAPAPLNRCDSCRGFLADNDTVSVAAKRYHTTSYVMVEGHGRHRCRACGHLFDGTRKACPVCEEEQWIDCTRCDARMAMIHVSGVTLDVCWPCRMVWFDRGELGLLVRRHARELGQRLSLPSALGLAANAGAMVPSAAESDALAVVTDVMATTDNVMLSAELAEATVRGIAAVVESAPDLAATAGEAALSAGEVAVEASSVAVDVLLSIVAGIFD